MNTNSSQAADNALLFAEDINIKMASLLFPRTRHHAIAVMEPMALPYYTHHGLYFDLPNAPFPSTDFALSAISHAPEIPITLSPYHIRRPKTFFELRASRCKAIKQKSLPPVMRRSSTEPSWHENSLKAAISWRILYVRMKQSSKSHAILKRTGDPKIEKKTKLSQLFTKTGLSRTNLLRIVSDVDAVEERDNKIPIPKDPGARPV
jgi:hypothetical protein